MYGYDSEWAYLVDTKQQGGLVKTSLKSLALARNEKGPMSSRNRMYSMSASKNCTEIEKAILPAMQRNAFNYLNPPIQNIGYKGIIKTASEIKKWFQDRNTATEFCTVATLMEKAGTGGALFRNLYRDFIKESFEILGIKEFENIYSDFCVVAELWTKVASLFFKAGESGEVRYINEASDILQELALLEKEAMIKIMNLVK